MSAPDVSGRLDAIRATIAVAAARSGREPDEVTIVAAAKTVAPDRVRAAIAAGITAIGHNYVQELRAARETVTEAVEWHYLGALRSGTAHLVADHADVVQTVAGERATRRLAGRAARAGRELEVLIEVDFTGERPGVAPEEVLRFTDVVAGLPGVRPRGLMTVAPRGGHAEDARPWFRALRGLRDVVCEEHPDMVDLSMGMSLDYAIAVEEGATMVRIGSLLFGPRSP
jgi:hypothetical protein